MGVHVSIVHVLGFIAGKRFGVGQTLSAECAGEDGMDEWIGLDAPFRFRTLYLECRLSSAMECCYGALPGRLPACPRDANGPWEVDSFR